MGREKISLAYIYLHKPVILLEVVLLLIEVYKMFETGKNVHQNSNYLEYHSSEMLLLSLTYNTCNQMNMKHNKIISQIYKIVMKIQQNRNVAPCCYAGV